MAASGSVGALCVGALNPLDTMGIRWQTKGSDIMAGGRAAAKAAELESLPTGISAFAKRIIARQGMWQGLWYPGLFANCSARPIWRFILEGDRTLELDALGGVGGRL